MTSVSFPTDLFSRLQKHLRHPEEIAFMLAELPVHGCFRIRDLALVQSDRLLARSNDRADLDDEMRGEVIRWAWDSELCLIEVHSHGHLYGPACFSFFDLDQLAEWVPHVRWRLGRKPYVALVSGGSSYDGLVWSNGSFPQKLDQILIDKADPITTSGLSHSLLLKEAND